MAWVDTEGEYVARLISIELCAPSLDPQISTQQLAHLFQSGEVPEWRVKLLVALTAEAMAAIAGEELRVPHTWFCQVRVAGNTMTAGDAETAAALDVYHAHETPDNLNPALRRQWGIGSFVDNISHDLYRYDLLEVRRMDEPT